MAGKNFDPNELGDGINDINITPFVDVVLVLLVIFMVTAPVMLKDNLKVNLPKSLTTDAPSKSLTVGVAITKDGQILVNGSLVSEESFKEKLVQYYNTDPQTNFLISADRETMHGDLVRVIDLLKRQNLNKFALQVEKIKNE